MVGCASSTVGSASSATTSTVFGHVVVVVRFLKGQELGVALQFSFVAFVVGHCLAVIADLVGSEPDPRGFGVQLGTCNEVILRTLRTVHARSEYKPKTGKPKPTLAAL